ncbi:hypothetical protein BDFG_04332 [Blastomyces dermatitidis ATCC 26199]|nr:hypothetical protein BDFG_04332 [Blastomyces dermatitidis ATCC 26199]
MDDEKDDDECARRKKRRGGKRASGPSARGRIDAATGAQTKPPAQARASIGHSAWFAGREQQETEPLVDIKYLPGAGLEEALVDYKSNRGGHLPPLVAFSGCQTALKLSAQLAKLQGTFLPSPPPCFRALRTLSRPIFLVGSLGSTDVSLHPAMTQLPGHPSPDTITPNSDSTPILKCSQVMYSIVSLKRPGRENKNLTY